MLEGVDQVVVGPAIDVEPGVAGGPELLQVVPPLLLMVDAVPLHHLPDLITNAHILTLTRPNAGGLSLQKGRLELPPERALADRTLADQTLSSDVAVLDQPLAF